MKTNNSVLDPTVRSLFYNCQPKQETYKGYLLLSNVMHLGMGGSMWLTSVVSNNQSLANFSDDTFSLPMAEAKKWIDELSLGC